MIIRKVLLMLAGLLLVLPALGCSSPAPTSQGYAPDIDPAKFSNKITNPFMPLEPGTTAIYEGTSDGELEHIEVTVTTDTRMVMGVLCVVVRDTVTVNGQVIEDTYDWYAQDSEGNVWYFGEDSKTYENGVVTSTEGSWEAGVDGALPGIVMKASPQIGETYRQEYYPGVAEDMADVASITESVKVPYGDFEYVLKTRDYSPLNPDVIEYKYYASGVGFILETNADGGGRIELIEIRTPTSS
jgi:hypothetical protein